MKAPRFMTEYANCVKKLVWDTQSADSTTKKLAADRVDKLVVQYVRGYLGLVDTMDAIGSVLKAVKFYAEEEE